MTIATVRRLAADILNVGESRIKISPEGLKEAEGALTRVDVKGLIDKGVITKAKQNGRASKRKKERRGKGRRKGSLANRKKLWMQKVRAQRKFLSMLIESGALDRSAKRSLYGKVKSSIFKSKKTMLIYLKENGLLPEEYEPPKPEPRPRKKPEVEAEKQEGESK
jgi:large subunit ribosomal protein L19e